MILFCILILESLYPYRLNYTGKILTTVSLARQFGTMIFQSINKIKSSNPSNITAYCASVPWSHTAIAVAFRYTVCKLGPVFLLIKAVLSPLAKFACIPLVRSVLLHPFPSLPPSTNNSTFTKGREEETKGLQLCPYSQHLTMGPDVHMGNSNNLSNVSPWWDPAPANVAWWCAYWHNKYTSGWKKKLN